jgi:spermidine/putrescine transport system ATP-binding protein
LKLRKQMQIELKNLQERVGITFIYVTHDQEEALTMSDRIAVMHQGRVLQVGQPVEIYEDPANRFVADFIGESNFLEGTVEHVGTDWAMLDLAGVGEARARRRPGLQVGEHVICAIRPEKMHLRHEEQHPRLGQPSHAQHPAAGPPANGANVARGQITNEVYIGTDTQYLVRLGDDHVITVREQTADTGTTGFGRGDDVHVTWSADSTLILID